MSEKAELSPWVRSKWPTPDGLQGGSGMPGASLGPSDARAAAGASPVLFPRGRDSERKANVKQSRVSELPRCDKDFRH